MDVLVISTSPNVDGLTAACAAAAVAGAQEAGATAEEVRLNDLDVALCEACDDGWGTCRPAHTCQVRDDFQALHQRVCEADALILVTPVYFGQMSESAKAFADRFRRCEATRGDESCLAGKPVVAVAAAGGSGGGTLTCLSSMEHWIQHCRGHRFETVPVTRWTREYALETIQTVARALVKKAAA
jgi:multimeric flavodoxin WrbA